MGRADLSGFLTPVGVTNESGGATVLCTRSVSRTQPRLQRLSQRQGKHVSELPITILKMKKKKEKMVGRGTKGIYLSEIHFVKVLKDQLQNK